MSPGRSSRADKGTDIRHLDQIRENVQLAEGLEGSASYSFQETKDSDTHQFLDGSPRHLAKLSLTHPLLRKTLFASLNSQYRSGMTTITGGWISPFSVVNFDLLGRRIARHVDVTASVYNLLDKKYYDPPSTAISEGRSSRMGATFA